MIREYLRKSSYVAIGTGVALVFEYLFHAYLALRFSIAEYGLFSATYSLLFLLSTFSGAGLLLQVTAAVKTGKDTEKIFSAALRLSLLTSLALSILLAFASFFTWGPPLYLLIPVLIVYSLLQVARSIFYGKEQYGRYAFITGGEVLLKFLFVLLLSLHAVTSLTAFSAFLLLLFLLPTLRPYLMRGSKMLMLWKQAIPITIITLLSLSLLRIDTILIQAFNSNAEAGLYNVASAFSRTLFYLLSAHSLVLFPQMVQAKREEVRAQLHGLIPLFLGTVLLIQLVAPYVLPVTLRLLFPKYLQVVPTIRLLLLSACALFVVQVCTTIFLARRHYRAPFYLLLGGNALLFICIASLRSLSFFGYAIASVITSLGLAFAFGFALHRHLQSEQT